MMTDEILGVTTCPTCQKRFRVSKKYESFIGKPISCPKCKRPFTIRLETPAPIEQAATANQTDSTTVKQPVDESADASKRKKEKADESSDSEGRI